MRQHRATRTLGRAARLLLWVVVALCGLTSGAGRAQGTADAAYGLRVGGAAELGPAARVQQTTPSPFRPVRFWSGNATALVVDLGVMTGLSRLWYTDYEQTRFHWHDDWDNWKQQDKLGHLVTAWYVARLFGAYGRWSGLPPGKAGWYGGLVGTVFLSQIEILDGFSAGWGASWTDLAFNTAGVALGGLQVAYPELNALALKYSYHRSPYYDPDVNFFGNVVKDYDGVSSWLVVRPRRLMGERLAWWPNWLAVAVGHSADGLKYARPRPDFPHRRQLYVGLDFDVLEAIEWPRPWMRVVAKALSLVRLPAPAVELTPTLKFHALYY